MSRPSELPQGPLVEPYGTLSRHTAPTEQFLKHNVPPVHTVKRSSIVQLDPFAPAALPAFIATTNQSAPVFGIGTLASWFLPFAGPCP